MWGSGDRAKPAGGPKSCHIVSYRTKKVARKVDGMPKETFRTADDVAAHFRSRGYGVLLGTLNGTQPLPGVTARDVAANARSNAQMLLIAAARYWHRSTTPLQFPEADLHHAVERLDEAERVLALAVTS